MKTKYSLLFILCCGLVGCDKPETKELQILSVVLFEPSDNRREVMPEHLDVLTRYADAKYGPNVGGVSVGESQLEKLGFKYRFSQSGLLSPKGVTLFNQGLPSLPKKEQDIAVGLLNSTSKDKLELSIYVGSRLKTEAERDYSSESIARDRRGAFILSNGWVAAWTVEPKQG